MSPVRPLQMHCFEAQTAVYLRLMYKNENLKKILNPVRKFCLPDGVGGLTG